METMREVKDIISKMSGDEVHVLRKWIEELEADLWDRQIEADLKAGVWDEAGQEALKDLEEGRCRVV